MSEFAPVEMTEANLLSIHQDGAERIRDYFGDKKLGDVMSTMPKPTYVDIDSSRQVQLLEIGAEGSELDFTRTIVLGLPFLNGLAPHQYMRAKALQLMVDPNVPVVVMPNNSYKNDAYTFTADQKRRLAYGSMLPVGEVEMAALERLQKLRGDLGAVQLTGYSQGGSTVLAMGAVGSSSVNVISINADEAPSKNYRNVKQLKTDFLAGGVFDVPAEAKDSGIRGLAKAQSKPRFIADVARFGVQSLKGESKLIQRAMADSVEAMVNEASFNGVNVKLGYIATSPMFDPESIQTSAYNLKTVKYTDGFERGHACGYNIIKHALMAADGIR